MKLVLIRFQLPTEIMVIGFLKQLLIPEQVRLYREKEEVVLVFTKIKVNYYEENQHHFLHSIGF